MSNWKKGDTAVCKNNNPFKEFVLTQIPELNTPYKVRKFDGTHLWFEGFDDNDCWRNDLFEKMQNGSLAEQFLANEVIEKSEYERVFSLTAKF